MCLETTKKQTEEFRKKNDKEYIWGLQNIQKRS